jgi:hypothetical protein
VDRLKRKFQGQSQETLFPEAEVSWWKKTVIDGCNRTMMEGENENDLFKNTFPIPRKHSDRTRLFPFNDFQDENMHTASRRTDLHSLCQDLIKRERFHQLAKLLITYKCIGRGGEVKFLSYQ